MIRSQNTAHMNFYRKSAGVLQEDPKEDFVGVMVKKWWENGDGGWIRMLSGLRPCE